MPIYKNQQRFVIFQSLLMSGNANTLTTPTVQLSLDGGALVASQQSASHLGNGCWGVMLQQDEMNHDQVTLVATATGCIPAQRELYPESDWTSSRAAKIDNLDATISSRSTFSGGAVAGVTNPVTVGAYASGQDPAALMSAVGYTSGRASNLDRLDIAVSTRSTYSGGPVSSVVSPVTVGQNNDKNGYGLSPLYSQVLQNATAQSGTATTIVLNGGSSIDNLYSGNLIMILGGTGSGQTRVVTGYNAATQTVTVNRPWTQVPDSSSQYAIIASESPKLTSALEVCVGSYAAGMDPAQQIIGLGFTAARALNLDNLDARISTRSTYAGADTPGTSTLVGRLTSQRAANLDLLDASVSSRLSTLSYVAPPTAQDLAASVLATPAHKLATDGSGRVYLDLTQSIPLTNTPQSIGDALNAARAQGFGSWKFDPALKSLCLYAPDGTTVVRQFTLDSSTTPTTRS